MPYLTDRDVRELRKDIKKLMDDWEVPGLSISIVKDDDVILTEGFGYRDLHQKLPVTDETLFPIGSASKAFTTTAVGILVDDGKLDWDTPVRHYLPEFALYDEVATERITLRDMACHRSGLPGHDLCWIQSKASHDELIARMKYLQPSCDFRTRWQYHNLMYITMGQVISKAAGEKWHEFIRGRIFSPLGMHRSNFYVETSKNLGDFSLPYGKLNGEVIQERYYPETEPDGAGSINSCARDLEKWLQFNLSRGRGLETSILSVQQIKEIHTPHMVVDGLTEFKELPLNTYGLGWCIQPYRGYKMIHHNGAIDGFRSMVSFMPDEGFGIAITMNQYAARPLEYIIRNLVFDRLLNLETIDWNMRYEQLSATSQMSTGTKQSVEDDSLRQNSIAPHPSEGYAGVYFDCGYGELEVVEQSGALQVVYNDMTFRAVHINDSTFQLNLEFPVRWASHATFHTDSTGIVEAVSIAMEKTPGVDAIRFTRMRK